MAEAAKKESRLAIWQRIKSLIPLDGADDDKAGAEDEPESEAKKANEARQSQAEQVLGDFVNGALSEPKGPPPPWRVPKPQDSTKVQEDRAKMRGWMSERWTQIHNKARHAAANRAEAAHDYVWSVYTRQRNPHELDELIYVYMMASHAYDAVQNKIDERGYFEYFFNKVAHNLLSLRDKFDNTLLHYLLALEGGKSLRVLACCASMSQAAKRRAKEAGVDDKQVTAETAGNSDDRKIVHAFFSETRNVVGESIMDLVMRFAQRPHVKQVEDILAKIFLADDGSAGGPNASGIGIDRVQAVQEKPFNPHDLKDMVAGGDAAATALYVRMFAEDIDPASVDTAMTEHKVDLLSVDLKPVTLPKDVARNITKRSAFVPGALNNFYAKQGIFNIEYARKKLLRDDSGQRVQGIKDERGYNTYMQMAALPEVPHAFIANEHEFWDSIFTRISKFQAEKDEEKRDAKYFYTRVARDILDMPGNDGKTALHLAAVSGNQEVVRFILDKVLDFTAAEKLREAVEHRMAKELLPRRKAYLEEMRTNLGYLTGTDNDNHNAWTLALLNGRKEVLMAMVGRLEKFPEYLEILAILPIYAKVPGLVVKEGTAITLAEFAARVSANTTDQVECVRYFKAILREAESRTQLRKEQGRNIKQQGLV